MTIKQTVRFHFECELCRWTNVPRATMREALHDQGTHMFEAHPSWVAEREAAGALETQPIETQEGDR